MEDVSPNAYAILGLLEARPWSAYELARHMKTSSNLRQIWPRAESKIYEAPKELEAAGLVSSHEEETGRRRRTVYEITPEGRRALRRWLDQTPRPVHMELEGALRVAVATAGTLDQLKTTVHYFDDERRQALDEVLVALPEILEQGFTIPERAHTSALVANLLARIHRALGEWIDWAQEIIDEWDDVEIDDEKRAWAESVYRDLLSEIQHAAHADKSHQG